MNEDKTKIIERIRKLMALGSIGSGASEHEAESAMSMAAALMAKHQIEVLPDAPEAGAIKGDPVGRDLDEMWHINCGGAAAVLYSCRHSVWRGIGVHQFVGRPDAIKACEATFFFLVGEVERLYKLNLPRGMTKADRAEYRRTFKFACSRRIQARAWAIMEELRNSNTKAIAATGKNALVVASSIDQQLAEAQELLKDAKSLVVHPRAAGLGTAAGRDAGNTVRLQEQVGSDVLTDNEGIFLTTVLAKEASADGPSGKSIIASLRKQSAVIRVILDGLERKGYIENEGTLTEKGQEYVDSARVDNVSRRTA